MMSWTPSKTPVAFTVALALAGCDDSAAALPPAEARADAAATPIAEAASASSSAPTSSATRSASPTAPRRCAAPSLRASDPIDARADADLDRCDVASTGAAERANRCGQDAIEPPLDLARLDEGVLPLDTATVTHVRRIAARGSSLGRQPRVFGLVGDSMTVSGAFMRPLSAAATTRLAVEVESSLESPLAGGDTIIDYYRGVEAQRVRGLWADSFRAPRAARVGARAPWPLIGGGSSPLETMIAQLSPAIAVVLFGGNDAAWRAASVEELSDIFAADLERVLDALEKAGVVPVLNTVARHGDAPGYDDCGRRSELSDWRIAVQTSALSARVVEIACRRRLPLIDLRHALDAAEGRGIGSDGVHPSSYVDGAGVLTARGLRCGYNVRNYVTLKMLAQLGEILFAAR